MEFTTLDKLQYMTDRKRYEMCSLMVRASMLHERHAKMTKRLKATNKGTKFNFALIESSEEFTEEANRIVEEANMIKAIYGKEADK